MSIYGNVILPHKKGFVYGENQPNIPCLWFNAGGAKIAADPDVTHGLLLYIGEDNNPIPLYPMTTIGAVYELNEKLTALANADTEAKKKLDGKIGIASVELPVDGWNEKAITVNVGGVTETNTVIVSCAAESYEAYCEAAVRCTGQGEGTLSFVCEFVPASAVAVNIVILNEVSA